MRAVVSHGEVTGGDESVVFRRRVSTALVFGRDQKETV